MLMRGEWCELQQLVQIQGAVIRGGGRTPQKGLRGAWPGGCRGMDGSGMRKRGNFCAKTPDFPLTPAVFSSRKVSNLVSQRKACLVCACINQSAACISPSPRPSVSLFPTVLCHRGSARLQSNQRPC